MGAKRVLGRNTDVVEEERLFKEKQRNDARNTIWN